MKRLNIILSAAVCLCAAVSCEKQALPGDPAKDRKVLIYYGIGYNNLSYSMREDIDELVENAPSPEQENYYKLLVFEHLSKTSSDYNTPTSPLLLDVRKDPSGEIIRDTVKIYPTSTVSASAETLREVLTYIKENVPAKEYGFVFSSHGAGWLPQGYYAGNNDDDYFTSLSSARRSAAETGSDFWKPSSYRNPLPGPLVKSIGAQYSGTPLKFDSKEMEIRDFAGAFPMKMEYIVLDACLMGGIEMAYELREVTKLFVGSQTEIMSEGFEYKNMLNRLLYPDKSDVKGMCEDYYNASVERGYGATVSLVNCSKMDSLAEICKLIFDEEREKISKVDPSSVQKFFRENKHWFYDLRDIVEKAGISGKKLQSLDSALEECVEYSAHTSSFLGIKLNTDCGFSMYLPCNGSTYLDSFYADFAWNKATSLVK